MPENREAAAQTDEYRAMAFRLMLAHSGWYRTDGNKIIIKIDIALDESWKDTEQVRYHSVEADRLNMEAPPLSYANFGGRVMRGILVWTREA
jgi:hypothetical protein